MSNSFLLPKTSSTANPELPKAADGRIGVELLSRLYDQTMASGRQVSSYNYGNLINYFRLNVSSMADLDKWYLDLGRNLTTLPRQKQSPVSNFLRAVHEHMATQYKISIQLKTQETLLPRSVSRNANNQMMAQAIQESMGAAGGINGAGGIGGDGSDLALLPSYMSVPNMGDLDLDDSKPSLDRPVRAITDTYVNEFPRDDVLNGVQKRVIRRMLCLDSTFRNSTDLPPTIEDASGCPSMVSCNGLTANKSFGVNRTFQPNANNWTYVLPFSIANVVSMKVCSLEIPNTWFQYADATMTNVFYITTDYNSTVVRHKIVIPQGNWDSWDLALNMRQYFSNSGNHLAYLYFDIDIASDRAVIRFNHSSDTDRLVAPSSLRYKLEFRVDEYPERDLRHNAGWSLGFRCAETDWITNADTKVVFEKTFLGYLESESIFGGNRENYFYLCVDDFAGHNHDTVIAGLKDGFMNKHILARIVVRYGSYYVNIDDSNDRVFKQREYFGPVKIEKLRIQLLDRWGDPLELNQVDYSLVLELCQLYSV